MLSRPDFIARTVCQVFQPFLTCDELRTRAIPKYAPPRALPHPANPLDRVQTNTGSFIDGDFHSSCEFQDPK